MKAQLTVHLRGGLGNQLFQIAAGVKICHAEERALRIDSSQIEKALDPSRRNFLKRIDINSFIETEGLDVLFINSNRLQRFTNSFFKSKSSLTIDDEVFMDYLLTSRSFKDTKILDLRGWFNNKFALNILKEIPVVLPLNPSISFLRIQKLLTSKPDSIIVHIRGGDFIQNGLDTLGRNYYHSAISHACENKLYDRPIYCFTDDFPLAHNFLRGVQNVVFPETDGELDPVEVLSVLSNAKTLISSKSTLSWWGSAISTMNGGNVISPWGKQLHLDSWKKL